MRTSIALGALALSVFDSVNALSPIYRRFQELADQGLLPDGTPMKVTPEMYAALKLGLQSSSSIGSSNSTPEDIKPEYVTLPVDHFGGSYSSANGSGAGTYQNRFWVAESGYKPGGPVFIYDAGEQDAGAGALFRLQDDTSFFKWIVDQFGGIGIVWEHRFYGNSTPVNITLDTPPEIFKYLTTEQSLADVDAFARQFSRPDINVTLTPDKTPWIFVGGSYPGMRAAFMRDRYPDTIYASYASSAPVEARLDMSVYFDPVWKGMNAYGFGNCTKDIQAAIRYMDDTMEKSPAAGSKLKEKFLGLGAGNNSDATFADALTTPFYMWQSYSVEGGTYGLRSFCDWLATDPGSNATSGADGWAKSRGANYTVSRWAAYPPFVEMVNYYLTTNCSGSLTVPGNCNLNLPFLDPSSISWTWQYCTQWGFFQSANLGEYQLISKFNSLQHQADICHRQFPTASAELLPPWPLTDKTNDVFHGWHLRPSNTYWSGGEFDPWRTLSPLSSESFAPHPKTFTNPPQCGVGQDEEDIFAYVMPGAQHAYDFRTTFAQGAVSRKFFTDALTEWLKCFKASNKGEGKRGVGHPHVRRS